MRERQCDFQLTFSIVVACRKIEQEAGQLLADRMGESNRSHFCDCRVIGFTQLLRHAQTDFAVLSQDYATAPVAEIGRIESVMTVVGGRIVYEAAP